ncbi:non-specific serine/threonine protein kinase OS=Streptomyces tendae OX=1932 GN=GUR47_04920 PE=3 SV=1 [Streptomyces tendae]
MLRVACSGEGFARARVFTRDTLRGWSLDHRGDDAVLVVTELVSNAVTHAVPSAAAGVPEIRLGLALGPGDLTLASADPGAACRVPPVRRLLAPGARTRPVHRRRPREGVGLDPAPAGGQDGLAALSTCPLT